jgi:hypothetical protein
MVMIPNHEVDRATTKSTTYSQKYLKDVLVLSPDNAIGMVAANEMIND